VSAHALTLPEAMAKAMGANPQLAAAGAHAEAAEGHVIQARTWPNPEIEVERENFSARGPGGEELHTTVRLEQSLEFSGMRRARRAGAEADRLAARREVEALRLGLRKEVEQAFVRVLGAQQRVELAEAAVATAVRFDATVNELVAAGKAAHLDRHRAAAELAMVRLELDAARQDLSNARIGLSFLWGEPEASFGRALGELVGSFAVPEPAQLRSGLTDLPDLIRHRALQAGHQARRDEVRHARLPGVNLHIGRRRFSGDGSAWLAGVGVHLPIWDRQRGQLAELDARIRAAQWEMEAERVQLESFLNEVVGELGAAERQVAAFREEILPALEAAHHGVEEGYRAGKFSLLDLLEARRAVEDARSRALEAQIRLNLAVAELARLNPARETGEDGEES